MRISAIHTDHKGTIATLISRVIHDILTPKTSVQNVENIGNIPDYALADMPLSGTDLGRSVRLQIIERDRERMMAA